MATTVVVSQPHAFFDEYGYQYKCCCRCCHVKTGTLVIGILSAIGIVLSFIQNGMGIANVNRLDENNPDLDAGGLTAIFIVQMIVYALQGIAVVCLFIGWAMEKRHLLIPFMAIQVLQMLLVVAMAIFFVVVLIVGGDFADKVIAALSNNGTNTTDIEDLKDKLKGITTAIAITMIILYIIILGIQIWLFTVILGCFRFFRDKEEFYCHHGGHPPQNVQYAAQPQTYPGYPQPHGQPEQAKYGY